MGLSVEGLLCMATPAHARNAAQELEREECSKCRTKGKVVFLAYDGPGKKHDFCWKCDGYSSPPFDELNYPGRRREHPNLRVLREASRSGVLHVVV